MCFVWMKVRKNRQLITMRQNINKKNKKKKHKNAAEPTSRFCRAPCRKLLTEVEKMKQSLLAEFRDAVEAPTHLLELALNEAEALAVQTGVPQLVFPTLAMEKAQAVVAWHRRQQALHRGGYAFAVAA